MSTDTLFHRAIFDRIDPEKRDRVIACAAEEFAERGLSSANINTIADRAAISVGSLYKYFESKTHLYLEVVNHGLSLIERALGPILDSDATLGQKIDQILDAILESARTQPVMTRLYNRFTSEGDDELTRQLATRLESITARAYTDLLRQAREEGVIANDWDETVLAFCVDNLFLALQFSLTSAYWRDRMTIYLGDDILDRQDHLRNQISKFIRSALGIAE